MAGCILYFFIFNKGQKGTLKLFFLETCFITLCDTGNQKIQIIGLFGWRIFYKITLYTDVYRIRDLSGLPFMAK